MKFRQILFCAALGTTTALCGTTAFAAPPTLSTNPLVTLSVSGSLRVMPNYNYDPGIALVTVSVNAASVIKLVNESSAVQSFLQEVTGTNKIPANSYFVWNPFTGDLITTNKNGFHFPLSSSHYSSSFPNSVTNYNIGYLGLSDFIVGTYHLTKTGSGSETDYAGFEFYLTDGLQQQNTIYVYGMATLNWTYGAVSNGVRKASLSVSFSQYSSDECFVEGYLALPASFTGSGNGAWAEVSTEIPFFGWWDD